MPRSKPALPLPRTSAPLHPPDVVLLPQATAEMSAIPIHTDRDPFPDLDHHDDTELDLGLCLHDLDPQPDAEEEDEGTVREGMEEGDVAARAIAVIAATMIETEAEAGVVVAVDVDGASV